MFSPKLFAKCCKDFAALRALNTVYPAREKKCRNSG
ncbi:MAG: hypothetical protein QOJ51_38 [Acidobacteriaceae bacterium]|jgi:hypothetical protein|nr:hypothetical protein [Acidobacteriaceae bacterium]